MACATQTFYPYRNSVKRMQIPAIPSIMAPTPLVKAQPTSRIRLLIRALLRQIMTTQVHSSCLLVNRIIQCSISSLAKQVKATLAV